LAEPLFDVCRDPSRSPSAQATAAEALADVLERELRPAELERVTVLALPEASRVLLRKLVDIGPSDEGLAYLRGVLAEQVDDPGDEPGKEALAGRQAAAAIALAALGVPDPMWPLLRHRADPRIRSVLIQCLAANTLLPRLIVDRLSQPPIDSTERQALLLACAEMHQSAGTAPLKAVVVARARALHRDDPDPGVHSAAELLLRRSCGPDVVANCDAELRGRSPFKNAMHWELGPEDHTFAVLPGPLEFRMGAAPHETAHYHDPILHYRRIERTLAVATKEVTVEQFQRFKPNQRNDPRYGDEPERVAVHISWFEAAAYCNWLSEKAGIAKSQWCYPENVEPGLVVSEDAVMRTGYRLPTEAEWEYFCRAGTETSRPYGESRELLTSYAWTWLNSDNKVMPPGRLLPNEFGLFDVLGNAWEWCHDGPPGHYRASDTLLPPYPRATKENPAPDRVPTETIDSVDRAHETWRILRGGAYSYAPDRARSAFRDWQPSSDKREYLGFRVVRTMPNAAAHR
jgi:formylglycine-generating enzyme required for sulfatase activity